MNTCKLQGSIDAIASRCINSPLASAPPPLGFSSISPIHCKFPSPFCGQRTLRWQMQQWAGKPICRGTKVSYNMTGITVTCKAPSVGESEFEEKVLNSDLPVLVDFVADWCGPCRLIAPFIDWAAQEYKGKVKVFKIDHDANPQLVDKYKVYGLPTLILFKDGKEVSGSRREGAITKDKLKIYLDELLESVAAL